MIAKARQRMNRAQKKRAAARFYKLNSILGNTWAMFFIILGGRMTGKSYSITDYLCNQKKKKGEMVQNYWMRISETSTKAMLANKAERLVDIDLVRKYKLNLTTKGSTSSFNRSPRRSFASNSSATRAVLLINAVKFLSA